MCVRVGCTSIPAESEQPGSHRDPSQVGAAWQAKAIPAESEWPAATAIPAESERPAATAARWPLCAVHRKSPAVGEAPSVDRVSPYLVFTSVAALVCSEHVWVGVPPALPYCSC